MKIKGILLGLVLTLAVLAQAQTSVYQPLYNPGNTYSLANLLTTTVTRDTVTNAGTGYLNSKRINGSGEVTIQANVTDVSGTTAGSLTLWGSLDGVNYAVIPTTETQTSVTVGTLTDQAGTKAWVWRLVGSDFLYYRVVQSGGTTAVTYLDGFIMKH